MKISFKGTLEKYEGEGAWYFVSVPTEYYSDIKLVGSSVARGFGSVRVTVKVGSSTWQTSIFPNNSDKTYLLFIKKAIRSRENIEIGDSVEASISLES